MADNVQLKHKSYTANSQYNLVCFIVRESLRLKLFMFESIKIIIILTVHAHFIVYVLLVSSQFTTSFISNEIIVQDPV